MTRKIKTINVKIKDLKAAKYNPRRISQAEMDSLVKSIEEFGFVEAIVVNKDLTIIGGHQRVKACKKLGIEEIPAIQVDLDKDKEKALNVALNKISGEWNEQLLVELIEELNDELVELTGFSEGELKRLFFKNNNKLSRSLLEDYIIPPFSIFDAKQPYWQKRKKEWIEQIGDSSQGRDDRDKDGNYYNFVGDTIQAMTDAGYKFYNEIILATAIANAALRARRIFNGSKKVVKTHQNILFFTKGKEVKVSGAIKRILETGQPAIGHHDVLIFKRN